MKKIFFVFFLAIICCKNEEKQNSQHTTKTDTTKVVAKPQKKENINELFEKFIIAFNSNDYKKLDQFIDKKTGCLFSYKDGYYPILTFSTSFKDNFDWFNDEISTNIVHNDSPEYLGDLEFKKNGFFYEDYKNKFSFDHFDNAYVNLPEETFQSNKSIKNKCNFKGSGISTSKSIVYEFYFSIYENSINLVAIDYYHVPDASYADPEKKFIAFNSVKDIQNFINKKKVFKDTSNNAFVNFSKNEITYYDFGDNPIQFSSYKINKIESINSKIKFCTVDLIFPDEETDNFTLTLSNKGVLHRAPMGVRPPYQYE
ncbi:hypothetical protein NAT51_04660 [Flavobacterium amniphilum]|uniref:hypothetical protein n=1 Tax=Flavobacterium amniphilum TaxID=1834035 RepID=UPI00202A641B|nr:hypothetical protein [Flavobacterium amniphilum]MCL9804799.1 hypothetical protein [Flavobacterium amniphilum]